MVLASPIGGYPTPSCSNYLQMRLEKQKHPVLTQETQRSFLAPESYLEHSGSEPEEWKINVCPSTSCFSLWISAFQINQCWQKKKKTGTTWGWRLEMPTGHKWPANVVDAFFSSPVERGRDQGSISSHMKLLVLPCSCWHPPRDHLLTVLKSQRCRKTQMPSAHLQSLTE